MARAPRVVMVPASSSGGGSAAGILLLLIAVVGLLALFTGNLERILGSIAGPAGGAAGIYDRGGARVVAGSWGEPTPAPAGWDAPGSTIPTTRAPVPA